MTNTNILLESGTNELEIVEFFLEELLPNGKAYTGYYGVNVAKVLEIIRLPKVTGLPNVPDPCLMGTFNLRDKVIPLVDLSLWLGKERAPNDAYKVVVTEFNDVINAFLVTGVTRIHRLSWEQIAPPDLQVQRYSGDSVTGVVQIENRVVFILDMEKIVGDLNPDLALKELDEAVFIEEHKDEPDKNMIFKTLIADDSTTIRRMIGASMEKAGFEVTRTINGRKAWEQLEAWKTQAAAEQRPITDFVHIVISDIEMPAMDGHSLTKRIKLDPVLNRLPVILFSSLITETLRHKGEAVGADDQISKPQMKGLAEKARHLAYRNLTSGEYA
jgi:two-component system, chemotaxis family, chemotaxis protein CheV